jgi:hypothetical protein
LELGRSGRAALSMTRLEVLGMPAFFQLVDDRCTATYVELHLTQTSDFLGVHCPVHMIGLIGPHAIGKASASLISLGPDNVEVAPGQSPIWHSFVWVSGISAGSGLVG